MNLKRFYILYYFLLYFTKLKGDPGEVCVCVEVRGEQKTFSTGSLVRATNRW
jgi:hypothetical protein